MKQHTEVTPERTLARPITWLAVAACASVVAVLMLPGIASKENPTTDAVTPAVNQSKADSQISFNRDIRPILSDKCFSCHGPDAAVAVDSGGFRLDIREGAIVPAEASGKVPIIPGDADNSEVIKRILSDKPNIMMPPPQAHIEVTDKELDLLKRWINEGAAYQGHWAYDTPVKPDLPEISESSQAWVKNDIDRFVAYQLERAGLSPSDEADKAVLIRRVSLDLTGLPPTPEDIDAFMADASPHAYSTMVDRLMQSPHFGERMALVWLDAARYGDTNGFHHDNIRTAWPWRQWVIQAFNRNMPYDQFVTEQLAGDLLPDATMDQILASGFCRMHNINDEGGALDEEYRVEAVADRIETIGTVFMAQTYTCARCHDHKYDPISQRDYFATWAYFNSVEGERGVYGQSFKAARAYPPFMMWQPDELRVKLAELEPRLAQARAEREKNRPALLRKLDEWQGGLLRQAGVQWAEVQLVDAASSNEKTEVQIKPDRSAELSGGLADREDVLLTLETDATGLRLIKLDALPIDVVGEPRVGRAHHGNAVLSHIQVTAISKQDPTQRQTVRLVDAWTNFAQTDGDFDIRNVLRSDRLGWAVGGHLQTGPRTALFLADRPFGYEGGTELRVTLQHRSIHTQHTLARVRVDVAAANETVAKHFAADDSFALAPVALIDRDRVPEEIYQRYFEMWRSEKAAASSETVERLIALEQTHRRLLEQAVPVLIMKEADEPVPAYILERGAYDKPLTDAVIQRRPPSMVDLPMPDGAPNNRLGFAMWLTRSDHPLTSRVHVNRLWQMLFGTGIVKSVEDFGSQADWPSHPNLLDYLAVSFVESGWDQKALIKQIVTSATYRQRAIRNVSADEIDAENRLLSYFPRQRLKAEFIRDQALFASGLLNPAIGGPSVKPYQPGDLWNEVAIGGTNTGRFRRDTGDKLYRRSMYTFWKKTSPPAQMQIFNAPTREFCTVSRDTTNTPLQVLTLWNDEQFLEAARVLAQRTLDESADDDARLVLIYRRCTGVAPDADELGVLQDVLAYYRNRYSAAADDAAALLSQGDFPLPDQYDPAELAAWMMVSSTVLSLDETIVRD